MPQVTISNGIEEPKIVGAPRKSWTMNYTVLCFIMNGQLYAEYKRIGGMLGLPSCSEKQWRRIIEWLEKHITSLADWTCEQVRQRGDQESWVTLYDGFYLTRGHYSNNSSASLHDHNTGSIAWYKHRTKRGSHHNWEGTSNRAEADMFDDILGEVVKADFTVSEMVTDKDSSMNSIYCRHFPEGTITYCSKNNAKTLHKDLQRIKQNKCQVRILL